MQSKLAGKIESIANKKGITEAEVISSLAGFLKKHQMSYMLEEITETIKKDEERDLEMNTVLIHSRYKLSKESIEEIKKLIGAEKSSPIKEIQRDSVLGGFIAEYKGQVYDASLEEQVNKFRKSLKEVKV